MKIDAEKPKIKAIETKISNLTDLIWEGLEGVEKKCHIMDFIPLSDPTLYFTICPGASAILVKPYFEPFKRFNLIELINVQIN